MNSYQAGRRLAPLFLIAALIVGCDANGLTDASLGDGSEAEARANPALARASRAMPQPLGAQLAAVRALTARYQRFDIAEDAGWDEDLTGCDPMMGHHYGNMMYVLDGGYVDTMQPEVLLYEPQKNGRMRLVGVEYIVLVDTGEEGPPFTRPDEDPPVLFGRNFDWNAGLSLWMLHVWVWKNNPDGMFTPFNPTVSCEHAS